MRIGFDTSPIDSASLHKHRGAGFYVHHLKQALTDYFPENNYLFFSDAAPRDVDILHYPYFDPFFRTYSVSKKIKTVITIHDLIPLLYPKHFPAGIKGKIRWLFQKRLVKRASAIITDSESSKRDIQEIIGVKEDKVFVVYLAAADVYKKVKLTKKQIEIIKKKYNVPRNFLLYVGDVTWNKNLPRIIDATKSVALPFVMIGKALAQENFDRANPWNADLVKVQSQIEDAPHIYRLGFVPDEDLLILYNMATALVMPSLYEGFGLPILEAAVCGCPVIASRCGSIPEIGEDAVYYINPYSTEDIARGIQEVWENKSLQKELSEKGIVQAKKFSWKKTAQETLKAYEKVLVRK